MYFETGKTTLLEMDSEYLESRVLEEKRRTQNVWMEWQLDRQRRLTLTVGCTCEQFVDDLQFCPHVWASLLLADQKGWEGYLPRGPLVLEHSYVEVEDEPETEDEPLPWNNAQVPKVRPNGPIWKMRLEEIRDVSDLLLQQPGREDALKSGKRREVWYLYNQHESLKAGRLVLDFFVRETKKNGDFGVPRPVKISIQDLTRYTDPLDRELLGAMLGTVLEETGWSGYWHNHPGMHYSRVRMSSALQEVLLPRLCESGRFCRLAEANDGPWVAFTWDDGPPWEFLLEIKKTPDDRHWQIWGGLQRGEQRAALEDPLLLLGDGFVYFPNSVARLNAKQNFGWIAPLRRHGPILVPCDQQDELLEKIWTIPGLPKLDLPQELCWEQLAPEAKPKLRFFPLDRSDGKELGAVVTFDYDGRELAWHSPEPAVLDKALKKVLRRNPEAEAQAVEQLRALGFSPNPHARRNGADLVLSAKQLPQAARTLLERGWLVEAQGRRIRTGGLLSFKVASQIDWFELDGTFDFEGVHASLPAVLEALQRGDSLVMLDDGTQGMLPEEWLARYAPLARLGQIEGDTVRFSQSQAAILDALLATQPAVDLDAHFIEVRDRLRTFKGVLPQTEPSSFQGTLRVYQREGLGWFHFLREFHFGGCLADDMGLGKTIQVLALLEEFRLRRQPDDPIRPALVVVPRSLVHNWVEEANRFTPHLKVLDYSGLGRSELVPHIASHDLVVTTYGTLRRDIVKIKEIDFSYAILDEAQAIKNPDSQSAKACRLLQAEHRLALTGTPVENHLGELWSIFEFLNPGMLGRSSTLKLLSTGSPQAQESVDLLGQALRPFILRRTKKQVLSELPDKTEQTLYCELDDAQRKEYNTLRDHYRASLAQTIDQRGLNRSKIQVLEALLRLRQASCHPGLLDKSRTGEPSAKLETLLAQLHEILEEGHKALVFSQFTSLLAIVRERLDREGLTYEYLDGRTRNRKERVDHFQQDPNCRLFLISLKAGGQGLNLTAADYVFILDPWWNPAVEAQAVDRAHRIGQTRGVFAYRLIARDTVEEKILLLQGDKRRLAEAILTADNSVLAQLSADDLQLLLS